MGESRRKQKKVIQRGMKRKRRRGRRKRRRKGSLKRQEKLQRFCCYMIGSSC
jgi:hypothetical protein